MLLIHALIETKDMIVKLQHKNSRYADLTPKRQYVVIGIEADDKNTH